MIDHKNEYQKYADDAIRTRANEEGLGRLRMGVFWAIVGALAAAGLHFTEFTAPKWAALAIVGSAPLAIILLVVNFIRLPGPVKTSSTALIISFMTLIGAGATIFLARIWGITAIAFP